MKRPSFLLAFALLLSSLTPALAQAQPASQAQRVIDQARQANPALADELAAIYQATERFQNVEVALAEGYLRDPGNICERATDMGLPGFMGAMGIHFFRPDLLQITATEPRVNGVGTHTDFRVPAILLYEPQADGSLELVGVESLVFAQAWRAAGNDRPPSFMGHDYFHMIDNPVTTEIDEAHHFEEHYDLHMWLYRQNPHGLFSPFNPSVTCEHHTGQGHHH
jgi:hypothetical protein